MLLPSCEMEPVLGASLQDILRRRGPFLALQEFGRSLIEQAAEMTTEVSGRAHALKQLMDSRPIEARIMTEHFARQRRIFMTKAGGERIEIRRCDIATRQRGAGCPWTCHTREIGS